MYAQIRLAKLSVPYHRNAHWGLWEEEIYSKKRNWKGVFETDRALQTKFPLSSGIAEDNSLPYECLVSGINSFSRDNMVTVYRG